MNLIKSESIATLEANGAQSFGTSPYDGSPVEVIMADVVATPSKNQFGNDVIELADESNPSKRISIALRRGTPLDKKAYTFARFTAQESRTGVTAAGKAWSINKGITKKVFAI